MLISQLGRAVETDPKIILSKDELSRSKAMSFYADHPQQECMDFLDERLLKDPFELFGRKVLPLAWGIHRPSASYPDLLREKAILDERGQCVKHSPWVDKDGQLFRHVPSTHGGFGFTMKRTASMLFSRRMGGVAKEALLLVQASLGEDEATPSYFQKIQNSPLARASGRARDRFCLAMTEMRDFQLRLHLICLEKIWGILDHREHCTNPKCTETHLHRTTIFDTIFPERENKPRSFDLQPLEFSVLTETVEPLLRAVISLFGEQNEAYRGFDPQVLSGINAVLANLMSDGVDAHIEASTQTLARTCFRSAVFAEFGMQF